MVVDENNTGQWVDKRDPTELFLEIMKAKEKYSCGIVQAANIVEETLAGKRYDIDRNGDLREG